MTQSTSDAVARRLVKSRRSASAGGDTAARVAAACNDLYAELSRWVGPDGCHALFTRALAETQIEHPALGQIKLRARSEPYVDGVAEAIMAQGDGETAKALESMLVHLVDLLGRLIGEDMAMKLIEQNLASSGRGASSDSRREEA